jgi:transposase
VGAWYRIDAGVIACFAATRGVKPQPLPPQAQQRLAALVTRLGQIRTFETELDGVWRQTKGVANRAGTRMTAEMPKIGTLTSKENAKLAGPAPLTKDSSKQKGRRRIRGDRPGVHSLLYVSTGLVTRHNPDYTTFHDKLLTAAKPKKIAQITVTQKLLVHLNAKAHKIQLTFAIPLPA